MGSRITYSSYNFINMDIFIIIRKQVQDQIDKMSIKSLLKNRSLLNKKEIKEVLSNQKLLRHYKWFLFTPGLSKSEKELKKESVADLRVKWKLSTYQQLKHHILLEDPSGKTKGCGCIICSLRHKEYKQKKSLLSFGKEMKKFNHINNKIYLMKMGLERKYGDDFDLEKYGESIDPFESEIFDKLGGSMVRKEIINVLVPGTTSSIIRKIQNGTSIPRIDERTKRIQFDLNGKIINIKNSLDEYQKFRRNLQQSLLL